MIKSIIKKTKKKHNIFNKKEDELVKIYSHPRSGTHFLEAFVGENFYPNYDLKLDSITWGHWSNRLENKKGNPYGKIFGNHLFPPKLNDNSKKIYIKRDGRAVAYSMWKTPNFKHMEYNSISFHDYLKLKIDWFGTPSQKAQTSLTILEHWLKHCREWDAYAQENENTLILSYEDLMNFPYQQYLKIHNKFFSNSFVLDKDEIKIINKPVGLLPNKAKIDAWREVFTEQDNKLYLDLLKKH